MVFLDEMERTVKDSWRSLVGKGDGESQVRPRPCAERKGQLEREVSRREGT